MEKKCGDKRNSFGTEVVHFFNIRVALDKVIKRRAIKYSGICDKLAGFRKKSQAHDRPFRNFRALSLRYSPTGPFTIYEPQNQEIGEFCVVQERRVIDIEVPKR